MVTDTIENIHYYATLGVKIAKALEYIKTTNFDAIASGQYAIEGEEIFAIINEYQTKDKSDCEAEAHRKYIDVQYMIKGTELFGYAPLTIQLPYTDYNEQTDLAVYKEELSYLHLDAGMFIIFFPSDIHQPEVRAFEPIWVKKVVVKIKL